MSGGLTSSDASTSLTHAVEGTPITGHLETIAQAAQEATAARERLEAAIVAARRDRVALRAIADAAGVSHETVRALTSTEREGT